MLESFIKEYQELYEKSFSDGFKGEFERFAAFMCEPSALPSAELKERLNALNALFSEPLLVAVVGQFSSGKSSLLNALLKKNILPTGVVPVTAKPTFIKYAPISMLKALYEDGREEYLSISELADFVDQRKDLKSVKALYIYEPNEMLKNISFIDTPGLNSRSSSDTKETLGILNTASGLIWLSLIDNAARAGELAELELVPKRLKAHSLCLLNQKDKLNDDEIKRVLEHSKKTYDEFFSLVCAISAKEEQENKPSSGFNEIYEFLNGFDKTAFIKQNMGEIQKSMIAQQERVLGILSELEGILASFNARYKKEFEELKISYKKDFELLFSELKQNATLAANMILEHVSSKDCEYFRPKKSAFGTKYEKTSYQAQILNEGAALSAILYNDDKLAKIFAKMKRSFGELNEKIHADLKSIFDELKEQTLDFKARFESLRKQDLLHSDILHAHIRQFSCDAYALFVLGFEKELEAAFARLDLFFERINIKINTNYANAIRLTLSHFSEKISKQRASFESDPLNFALYFPNLADVKERVLNELSYYEFEDEIAGSSPFSTKFLLRLGNVFDELCAKNSEHLGALKSKHEEQKELLEKLL